MIRVARLMRVAGRRAAMGRRPLLSATEADVQPEPDVAARHRPVAQDAAQQLGREEAWAWLWAWPARGPKGAGRCSRADGGQDSGGCCARYWGPGLRRRRGGLSPPRAAARCGLVMATEQRPFHLVVFGASGFTGQFVTEEVAREQIASEQSSRLPWAVAGRSKEKLQQVLEKAAQKLGNTAGSPGWAGPGRAGRRSPRGVSLACACIEPCGRTGRLAWPSRAGPCSAPKLKEKKKKRLFSPSQFGDLHCRERVQNFSGSSVHLCCSDGFEGFLYLWEREIRHGFLGGPL